MGIVAKAVAIASSVATAAAFVPTAAQARSAPASTVPVLVCPTGAGVYAPPAPVASSAVVPEASLGMVVYSTTSGFLQVLAPRGMACQGTVAADGGLSLTVSPPYTRPGTAHGGVAAVVYPACVGCILSLACAFFPAARRAALHDGYGCAATPAGQSARKLGAGVVAFSDPPGAQVPSRSESLVPARSPYPTDGVAVYRTRVRRGHAMSVAMEEVCVLPAREHTVCTAVLGSFLTMEVAKFKAP